MAGILPLGFTACVRERGGVQVSCGSGADRKARWWTHQELGRFLLPRAETDGLDVVVQAQLLSGENDLAGGGSRCERCMDVPGAKEFHAL